MGLDMYLTRYSKADVDKEELDRLKEYVRESCRHQTKDMTDGIPLDFMPSLNPEAIGFFAGANKFVEDSLSPVIIDKEGRKKLLWFTLGHEVAYWRKANAVHRWFVENVQDGEDDCKAYFVTKEQLRTLLNCTEKALEAYKARDFAECETHLPTMEGFFFGETKYDNWYEEDLNHTVEALSKVIHSLDWNKEMLTYRASW